VQWLGWRRDGGDGRTGPMATEVTVPPARRHGVVLERAWHSCSSSLRGLRRPFSRVRCVGRTGVGGTVPQGYCWPCRTTSHSGRDGFARGVGRAVPGRGSQARRGADSSLTRAPANVSALNASAGGSRRRGDRPVRSSSETSLARASVQLSIETGPRSRRRPALERGGTPLEGVPSPRARWNLTRGGDRSSSEAEFYQHGAIPLERSGVPPEGG
jgi:hypothetical protein